MWEEVTEVLRDYGYTSWEHAFFSTLRTPDRGYRKVASGFAYATSRRGDVNAKGIGTVWELGRFDYRVSLYLRWKRS